MAGDALGGGGDDGPGGPRSFVMFFDEKEGTSPVLRLLDRFDGVGVVHQAGGIGWEPFDRHNCGPMDLADLVRCLDLLFTGAPAAEVNAVYRRTAATDLVDVSAAGAVGFKMRFVPPRAPKALLARSKARMEAESQAEFKEAVTSLLVRHRTTVLMAVRQNILRWALSKYHGDGTGNPGHLQFKVATGEMTRQDIPRIEVEPARLEEILARCEAIYDAKVDLAEHLRTAGVHVVPARYEDFLERPGRFLSGLLTAIGAPADDAAAARVLEQGTDLQRVHGDDLSEHFTNAAEIVERFGDRFRAWT